MKGLKVILIWLGILAGICLTSFVVYNVAYAMGNSTGYDLGFSTGEGIGYSAGQQYGYEAGRSDGYSLGKQEGYEDGYSSGKADGYAEGIEAGLGHGYTLRDPTYQQAIAFIRQDKTDLNEYVEDTYACSHFAQDVCNNAEKQGLRCAFVDIRYSDAAHAIIAFNTIDEGLVYFDAITDERVRPVVGKRYYQCIEPRPGYYYEPPPHDDTIKDILVIW